MPTLHRFLSRRRLLAFLGAGTLLFGLAMLHPYPRQSLFGPTIRGMPRCVWEDAIRQRVNGAEHEKTVWAKAMRWMGVKHEPIDNDGLLNRAETLTIFLSLASDSDLIVRRYVLANIKRYSDPSALPVLRGRLEDADPRCRVYAARAIYHLDPKEPVQSVLLDVLRGSDNMAKIGAIDGLAEMGETHPEILAELAKSTKDESDDVRARIFDGLCSFGAKAVPILCQGLEDPSPAVRSAAVISLRQFGPAAKEAVPPLEERLQDRDENVCSLARMALVTIDPKRFQHLKAERKID